jgi:hypothetical protein
MSVSRGRPRHVIAAALANEFDPRRYFSADGRPKLIPREWLAYHGQISTASVLAIGMTLGAKI